MKLETWNRRNVCHSEGVHDRRISEILRRQSPQDDRKMYLMFHVLCFKNFSTSLLILLKPQSRGQDRLWSSLGLEKSAKMNELAPPKARAP